MKQDLTATRYFAIGMLDEHEHMVVFNIEGDGIRVISLRRASKKERTAWAASQIPT